MAYNRKNHLQRVLEIQQITIHNQDKGISLKWIFENLICSNYHISKRTFASYLATNARKELKELKSEEAKEEKACLKLFEIL